MNPKFIAALRPALLVAGMLVLTGCNKSCTASFNVNSGTSSSDWTVNGRRTITRSHNGVSRKLETTSDVVLKEGKVATFPQGALVKVQETQGAEQRQAELRENEGRLELWINEQGTFRKGSPEEEAWLERFLEDITAK